MLQFFYNFLTCQKKYALLFWWQNAVMQISVMFFCYIFYTSIRKQLLEVNNDSKYCYCNAIEKKHLVSALYSIGFVAVVFNSLF